MSEESGESPKKKVKLSKSSATRSSQRVTRSKTKPQQEAVSTLNDDTNTKLSVTGPIRNIEDQQPPAFQQLVEPNQAIRPPPASVPQLFTEPDQSNEANPIPAQPYGVGGRSDHKVTIQFSNGETGEYSRIFLKHFFCRKSFLAEEHRLPESDYGFDYCHLKKPIFDMLEKWCKLGEMELDENSFLGTSGKIAAILEMIDLGKNLNVIARSSSSVLGPPRPKLQELIGSDRGALTGEHIQWATPNCFNKEVAGMLEKAAVKPYILFRNKAGKSTGKDTSEGGRFRYHHEIEKLSVFKKHLHQYFCEAWSNRRVERNEENSRIDIFITDPFDNREFSLFENEIEDEDEREDNSRDGSVDRNMEEDEEKDQEDAVQT